MDQVVMGKLLPNLKVTLGGNDDIIEEGEISDLFDLTIGGNDDIIEEGESSDLFDFPRAEALNSDPKNNTNIVRTWMQSLDNSKLYENKHGGFITGLDLSPEALMTKLAQRAERFGIEKDENKAVTQNEIDSLYKSLGIEPEHLNSCKLKGIRLEALHIRGVEDMSTEEIFKYFEDFGPASVEWINDISCNVIWLDASTTARALLALSQPISLQKKNPPQESKTDLLKVETDAIPPESDDSDDSVSSEMDVDVPVENSNHESVKDTDFPNVPVPPGQWRLGVPNRRAKAILLRFATKDDKKLRGAEKRSQYYKKYGNPNFHGLTGLISSSKKKKIIAERNRQTISTLTEDSKSQLDDISAGGHINNKYDSYRNEAKIPRMRMYADDEENKTKSSGKKISEGSIFSRLGTKYTKTDLIDLGKQFSSSESEQEDDTEINCTIPARLTVWTSIAKSMAREDGDTSKNTSHDCISEELQSYKEFRSSQDYRSSNFENFQSLSSHKRKKSGSRPTEDLRCKIKRLKEGKGENSASKHRSPLCKDE